MDLQQQDDLTQQLRAAALDGDAALILKLEQARDEQSAVEFANKCKQLRDEIEALAQERIEISGERAALEHMHELAAVAWRDAMDKSDQVRQEWQLLGLRLGGMDSRLSIIADDMKEKRVALTTLVSSRIGG